MSAQGRNVEIWHRPSCSNSRGALELLRDAGIEPVIVDYVANPPAKARLRQAIADAGLSVREAIRSKEAEYATRGLADPAGWMVATGVTEELLRVRVDRSQ